MGVSNEQQNFDKEQAQEKTTRTTFGGPTFDNIERAVSPDVPADMIDEEAVRRLRLKIDINLYPILFLIYALSFLDRINISNARIQGLTEELNLYGNRFNIALFVSST
jgi:hypothetical protein